MMVMAMPKTQFKAYEARQQLHVPHAFLQFS